jgi:hypothetical protein
VGTSTCTSSFVPENSSAYGANSLSGSLAGSFWRRHRGALAEASSWSTGISRPSRREPGLAQSRGKAGKRPAP